MSSDQRLAKLGTLEEKKQRAIALSVEIHHLREEINRATDASKPIASLALDELSVLMQRLQEKTTEHRQLCDDLRELSEDLNVQMPTTDVRRKR
jgi:hypothetical protein